LECDGLRCGLDHVIDAGATQSLAQLVGERGEGQGVYLHADCAPPASEHLMWVKGEHVTQWMYASGKAKAAR
jgi:hypothetical protein